MPVITIFSSSFCGQEAVIQDLVESTGHALLTDEDLLEEAARVSGIPVPKIRTAFTSRSSVFNRFTREKERSIAGLRLAVARALEKGDVLLAGFSALLIPRQVSHVLRVGLVAGTGFRLDLAQETGSLTSEQAEERIREDDENRAAWTNALFSVPDPWDTRLYDLLIPMENNRTGQAAALVKENLLKKALRPTDQSLTAARDFHLAARVQAALANAGHSVGVEASNGGLVLTIYQSVLMLDRLKQELSSIAQKIPGVDDVQIRMESDADSEGQIYRKHQDDIPSKVLLVDDEREFVQTLSERLQMRDMGCAVAFDGASALELVKNDDPEVMIIDLKMPGLDGMAVLGQVKQISPGIEVIILTGHGSEQDKTACMDMGAFSYLYKPVDINELSRLIQQAHEKVSAGR